MNFPGMRTHFSLTHLFDFNNQFLGFLKHGMNDGDKFFDLRSFVAEFIDLNTASRGLNKVDEVIRRDDELAEIFMVNWGDKGFIEAVKDVGDDSIGLAFELFDTSDGFLREGVFLNGLVEEGRGLDN